MGVIFLSVDKGTSNECRETELWPAFAVFAEEARGCDQIPDLAHKLAFLNTLKWPFWADETDRYDFWIDFLIARVQDPEGKVRRAAVLAAEYLGVAMLSSFDTPGGLRFNELSAEARARVRTQFFTFALKADELVRKHRTPELRKYKYISSMPPGIFKSCSQLLNQSLLTTPELKEQLLAFIRSRQVPLQLSPHRSGRA